jgi:hypothetical protein
MSIVGVVLGSNSYIDDRGGGATFSDDGREVSGYEGGDESFFIL